MYQELRPIEGLRYVGFKDIGATIEQLQAAHRRHPGRRPRGDAGGGLGGGRRRAALHRGGAQLGVDWILGGTHADEALAILAGSRARYCPFPGTIVGHPSLLRGTVESIAADAARLTALDGVHGLDLLAYRFDGDVEAAVAATVAASSGPGHRRRQRRLAGAHRDAGRPGRLGLHHRRRHLRGPLRGRARAWPPGARGAAHHRRGGRRRAEGAIWRWTIGRRPGLVVRLAIFGPVGVIAVPLAPAEESRPGRRAGSDIPLVMACRDSDACGSTGASRAARARVTWPWIAHGRIVPLDGDDPCTATERRAARLARARPYRKAGMTSSARSLISDMMWSWGMPGKNSRQMRWSMPSCSWKVRMALMAGLG